jgi:hypothetical protein
MYYNKAKLTKLKPEQIIFPRLELKIKDTFLLIAIVRMDNKA